MQAHDAARPRQTPARNGHEEDLDMHADELQASTSAETIRHLPLHLTLSTNISRTSRPGTPSQPSSPRSSLASPSSPSGDSVSSFPSVSSSFLFSSGPGSPPHLAHHSGHGSEHEHGDSSLIIPSLTLPVPLRRPTPYGQGLGEVRLLVLGREGVDTTSVLDVLADEEYAEIVEMGSWEESTTDGAANPAGFSPKLLRVSTNWIEHRDAHGLERHEPSRNVEILHLPDYNINGDPTEVARGAFAYIHSPFRSMMSVVHPEQSPNDLLTALLSSSMSPLYTVMVIVSPPPLAPFERVLIAELSTHIPLILLPPSTDTSKQSQNTLGHEQGHPPIFPALSKARLSSIRPESVLSLRDSIYRRPETLATLRLEAADRFLRWREIERAVGHLMESPNSGTKRSVPPSQRANRTDTRLEQLPTVEHRKHVRWDKSRWESEWEGTLSTDISRTLRTRRDRVPVTDYFNSVTASPVSTIAQEHHSATHHPALPSRKASYPHDDGVTPPPFDPLHIPSLVAFSISLLAPLKAKVAQAFRFHSSPPDDVGTPDKLSSDVGSSVKGWVLAGAFCAGVGVGIVLARL